MSEFKLPLAPAVLLALASLVVVTRNVSAGEPNGGAHDIIATSLWAYDSIAA